MSSVLPDTSVWITWLRRADPALPYRAAGVDATVWLSAVALGELYAGAHGKHREAISALEDSFVQVERILVPELADWKQAGSLLADVALRFGYEQIGRNRLTNDALLAVTASRRRLTLLTANSRDFGRLAELLPLDWQLIAH
jgi:predicted nucleic acid-binding protein